MGNIEARSRFEQPDGGGFFFVFRTPPPKNGRGTSPRLRPRPRRQKRDGALSSDESSPVSPPSPSLPTSREKPFIHRCFAWSQDDSQDEVEGDERWSATKRPRRTRAVIPDSGDGGVSGSRDGSSSSSSQSSAVQLSTTATPLLAWNSTEQTLALSVIHCCSDDECADEGTTIPPPTTPQPKTTTAITTKVHWDEKLEDYNELMSWA